MSASSVKRVLFDGGGRGRTRSDRRWFVSSVQRLLFDGPPRTAALRSKSTSNKALSTEHTNALLLERPSSAAPVEQNPLVRTHERSFGGARPSSAAQSLLSTFFPSEQTQSRLRRKPCRPLTNGRLRQVSIAIEWRVLMRWHSIIRPIFRPLFSMFVVSVVLQIRLVVLFASTAG